MRCNTLLLFYCAATALLGLFCLARLLALWVRDILFSAENKRFLPASGNCSKPMISFLRLSWAIR